jgi:hypothetical protein
MALSKSSFPDPDEVRKTKAFVNSYNPTKMLQEGDKPPSKDVHIATGRL